MKPGVYDNMTYEEYDAIDAIRASRLKGYWLSSRRGRHADLNPLTGRHLSLGNAVHTSIGEPDEFVKRYAVLGACRAVMASGQRKGEMCGAAGVCIEDGEPRCGRHGDASKDTGGVTLLTIDEHKTVVNLTVAVRTRRDIWQHFEKPHATERVLVWDDPDLGVPCKCRIDHHNEGEGVIVDLKTTSSRDVTARTIMNAVWDFGYHRSLAWYRRGCRSLGIDGERVLLVFLQTVQDCDVAAYWLEEDALDQGEREAMVCLSRLVEGERTGRYPGVQTDCTHQTVGLPEWAIDTEQLIDTGIEEVQHGH